MAMTTRAVADKLLTYCREGNEAQALNELYAKDAVSVEAQPMPGSSSAETVGLDGIRGKHDWWNNAMEVHSSAVDGPYMHGPDRFAAIFEMDATEKETGQRFDMKEIGIYNVENGLIVREEFFYTMP